MPTTTTHSHQHEGREEKRKPERKGGPMFCRGGFRDSFHVGGGGFEVGVVRFMVGFITVCIADGLG